jgi:hypothetical protein
MRHLPANRSAAASGIIGAARCHASDKCLAAAARSIRQAMTSDRINNIASGGTINFMIGGSSKFKVASNGYVGINTPSPAFPLEVSGYANFANGSSSSFFYPTGGLNTGYTGSYSNVTIKASDFILGGLIGAVSDERIKKIRGRSDGATDLRTLLGIEVTDFVYKDVVGKGNRPQKKVIAQQVEKVFPQAVSQTTDVVPDIYRKAPIHNGWIELATDLKVGDRVRLITENGHRAVHTVLEVADKKFRTDFVEDAGQVFVYGREVKDFRFVDYEAISMLNVSATQELNRIVMQQDSEIQALSARLAALEQILKDQQPRQKQQ